MMKAVIIRLLPGEDLRRRIEAIVVEQNVAAGVILSGVGSLTVASLRFAEADEGTPIPGPHEIVSLSGTVGMGKVHLHLVVADRHGRCFGGHLMPGSLIRTTCELVIGVLPEVRFDRTMDPATGYEELVVRSIPHSN
jgi:uncharacterized protein